MARKDDEEAIGSRRPCSALSPLQYVWPGVVVAAFHACYDIWALQPFSIMGRHKYISFGYEVMPYTHMSMLQTVIACCQHKTYITDMLDTSGIRSCNHSHKPVDISDAHSKEGVQLCTRKHADLHGSMVTFGQATPMPD